LPARVRETGPGYGSAIPGPLYCDTSALIKLFVGEPGAVELNRLLEGRSDLLLADLAVTETASALARRVRDGALAREAAQRLQRAVLRALEDGLFQRVEITRDVYRRAEALLFGLTATPLRAADALHLALATTNRAASMASFDARLRAAARTVGLSVYPFAQ
jgi:predicted nucleic acid-binding protein